MILLEEEQKLLSTTGIHQDSSISEEAFLPLSSLVAGKARQSWLKRVFDVLVSGMGILFSLPIWIVVAVIIKCEDDGSVFYGQERVGQGGRRFWSWKFRSMVADSDMRYGPMQAADGDSRVTRIGRILRATALDELPQLWNIFKGDMSLVGPRALMPVEIEVNGNGETTPIDMIAGYEERHQVKPGLTGLAQVYAPRDIPRRHKFRYDLAYIQNRSFWLDVKLIALSFWITFRGKWESRERKF
jgi:lipopolysaccharide/colanic/teichoic acid biosynthesis glycosyltransferase